MKDFRSRKKTFHFLQSPIVLFALVIILILSVKSAYISFNKRNIAEIEHKKFNNDYQDLVEKRDRLIKENDTLMTKEGIVGELKETFNVGENGESIIRITKDRE